MTFFDWTERTFSFEYLSGMADIYQDMTSTMEWLRRIGVVPSDVKWKRKNSVPKTNLNAEFIPADYLAELAYSWDQDGPSSPTDFMAALSFDIAGTRNNDELSETLSGLGREAE